MRLIQEMNEELKLFKRNSDMMLSLVLLQKAHCLQINVLCETGSKWVPQQFHGSIGCIREKREYVIDDDDICIGCQNNNCAPSTFYN